jgi:hypothetical protein
MKKQLALFLAIGILFLFFQSFSPEQPIEDVFPDEITSILKTSCYDCHFTGANSDKALKAVNFDTWDEYRTTKKIGILSDIAEVAKERKMPPGKYLKNKPDAELSDKQIKQLADWTQQEAEKLMQGN